MRRTLTKKNIKRLGWKARDALFEVCVGVICGGVRGAGAWQGAGAVGPEQEAAVRALNFWGLVGLRWEPASPSTDQRTSSRKEMRRRCK